MSGTKRPADSIGSTPSKKGKTENDVDKQETLKKLLNREIQKEINLRIKDLEEIQDRIFQTKDYLEKIRQGVVAEYYCQNFEGAYQPNPHPAITDTIRGKRPRNRSIEVENENKDENSQCSKDETTPVRMPRYVPPNYDDKDVLHTLEPRGNENKEKFRLVVGNVSKWISNETASKGITHKWTVYVKCKRENFDIGSLVSKVIFVLDPSYKPNDIVKVDHPPFKLTRRGWGEFPLRVQLHFHNKLDSPVDIIHEIKLDRTQSGAETFGAEKMVDVWAHCTTSDIKHEELPVLSQPEPSLRTLSEIQISKDMLLQLFDPEVKTEENCPDLEKEKNFDIKLEPEDIIFRDVNELERVSALNSEIDLFAPQVPKTDPLAPEVPETDPLAPEVHETDPLSPEVPKTGPLAPEVPETDPLAPYIKPEIEAEPKEVEVPKYEVVPDEDFGPVSEVVINSVDVPYTEVIAEEVVESSWVETEEIKDFKPDIETISQNFNLIENNELKPQILSFKNKIKKETKKIIPINGLKKPVLLKKFKPITSQLNLLKVPDTKVINKSQTVKTISDDVKIITTTTAQGSRQRTVILPPEIASKLISHKDVKSGSSTIKVMVLNKMALMKTLAGANQPVGNIPKEIKISSHNQKEIAGSSGLKITEINKKIPGKINFVRKCPTINTLELSDIKMRCPIEKVEHAVTWLLKNIPLIDERAKNASFKRQHPYCSTDLTTFLSWPVAKQSSKEWLRAKRISQILSELFTGQELWSCARIIHWARLLGFTPYNKRYNYTKGTSICDDNNPISLISDITNKLVLHKKEDDEEVEVVEIEPKASPIKFEKRLETVEMSLSPELVDLGAVIKDLCLDCNKLLKSEEIVPGVNYPAALHVMISVFNSIFEDLMRRSHASSLLRHKKRQPESFTSLDVRNAIKSRKEFDIFTRIGLGKHKDATL